MRQPGGGTHDLGSLLSALAPKADDSAAAPKHDPAVQQAGYHDIYELGKGLPAADNGWAPAGR